LFSCSVANPTLFGHFAADPLSNFATFPLPQFATELLCHFATLPLNHSTNRQFHFKSEVKKEQIKVRIGERYIPLGEHIKLLRKHGF